MDMRILLIAIVLLFALAGCGKSMEEKAATALEQNTKAYRTAIEELHDASDEEDIAAIVEKTAHSIDALRETEEWKAYVSIVEGGDTLALENIRPMQDIMREAALEFAQVLGDAAHSLAK